MPTATAPIRLDRELDAAAREAARMMSRSVAEQGGHSVPEMKIRERYQRLWPLVKAAIAQADDASVYDNSSSRAPYRLVARYERGQALDATDFPAWSLLQHD